MRRTLTTLAMVAVPTFAAAQAAETPRPEIGIRAGLLRVERKTDFFSTTGTIVTLPTSPFLIGDGIHALFFTGPRFGLEPHVGIMRISEEDFSTTVWSLALQGNYFLAPDATKAPYIFGILGRVQQSDDSDSEGQTSFGGGIGYRKVYGGSLAMRYELRYRHWTGSDIKMNEFGLLIGVGAIIPAAKK